MATVLLPEEEEEGEGRGPDAPCAYAFCVQRAHAFVEYALTQGWVERRHCSSLLFDSERGVGFVEH